MSKNEVQSVVVGTNAAWRFVRRSGLTPEHMTQCDELEAILKRDGRNTDRFLDVSVPLGLVAAASQGSLIGQLASVGVVATTIIVFGKNLTSAWRFHSQCTKGFFSRVEKEPVADQEEPQKESKTVSERTALSQPNPLYGVSVEALSAARPSALGLFARDAGDVVENVVLPAVVIGGLVFGALKAIETGDTFTIQRAWAMAVQ